MARRRGSNQRYIMIFKLLPAATHPLASALLILAMCCFAPSRVAAQVVHSVTSSADFASAIADINADPGHDHRIEITGTITMLEQVQAIDISGELTVVGATPSAAIDGGGSYRPFFIKGGAVSIENLALINGHAAGGNGGGGGGGGLGAGGAVFVDSGASLRLKNVSFVGDTAQGGTGGAAGPTGGAGGGLGGNGGEGQFGGGGGGGLYGAGGSGNHLGGGGGGGQLQAGGDSNSLDGAGGGGTITPGASGGTGGDGAGNGGASTANGADGSTGGGGGGGGSPGPFGPAGSGGAGGTFGGGGGGGIGNFANGGNGGRFGGGGGADTGDGGHAGLLGGGGGSGYLTGGNGGFGGGAGGGYSPVGGTPGIAGFGGGAAGSGGGSGTGAGGGGAAFGGALFVAYGADITIADSVTFSGNAVMAGGSLGDGSAGSADGDDLFIMSGVLVTVDVSAGNSLTFSRSIGNNDGINFGVGIIKEGEGTLTLTGNSSYVGGTFVDRGTLVVDGSLNGISNIVDRGTLTVNGTLAGQTITDRGTVNVNTGGVLNGDTATIRGVLDVNGTINGDVWVDEEGTLKGNGTINTSGNISDAVEVYGTIAPGNSIGTLHINGDYLQGINSVYEVEVNDAGQSDQILISGTAYLTCGCGPGGGDVHVIAAPGNYAGRRVYTILSAGGGIVDRFDAPTWSGFNPYTVVSLDYVGNDVLLIVSQFDMASAARTFNQVQTSTALNNVILTTDPQLGSVFTSMMTMNDSELRTALDQLSGELFGTLSSVGIQCTDNWLGSIGNRLRPYGSAAQAFGIAGTNSRGMGTDPFSRGQSSDVIQLVSLNSQRARPQHYGWVGGYGLGGQASSNGNAQGFNYGYGGTSFGVDRYLGENTIVGLAGGYAGSQVRTDTRAESANVNSVQGGLYGTHVTDNHYTYGILGYSHDTYDTTRALPANLTARGDFDGYQLSSYLESGLIHRWGAWNVQPSLGLQYIHLRQNSFTETGAGGAGLAVNGADEDSCRGSAGLRFARPTPFGRMMFVPTVQGRYGYEFCNVDRFVTANFAGIAGSTFTTAGNQLGRNFGQYGVGLNTIVTRNFGTYAGYDLVTSDRAVSHSGNAGLQFDW
jgi:uncharacterized protein with beta-barrel porin domain